MWSRHIINSVVHAGEIPEGARVLDIGSGAGLPGVPLALVRPDLQVVLLEPLLRRWEFLETAVDELGLAERVSVVRGRVEDAEGVFDVLTCRAVAPLPRLAGWCTALLRAGSELLALKGASAADEVAASGRALKKLGLHAEAKLVRVSDEVPAGWVVRVRTAGRSRPPVGDGR